ncbi:phosphatase yihX [Escherichia coli HVH 221 (4-3136817)]|nr:phosphatase yihX [Escherichia coli HVH 221 (4-3136817)]
MLYIFDLGNVIVDIDFNRVLGAWSDLTRIPLASLKKSFHMGEAFHQHERGEISDEAFAEALCHEMALPLSYEQFSHGWQAVFVALRPEVIAIMHKLREQGIAWWCFPIPTACIPPSGRKNTRKFVMLLTISICRKIWGCANLKLEFTSMFCRRKVFHPAIRSFSTITPII